jgi:diguanylate cyclase (GGDEF)-like protein/PAS domain S-box-containing protein
VTAEHPAFVSERVLDALELAVVVYDRDGRRVFVNRRARDGMEILGEAFGEDGSFGDVELVDRLGNAIGRPERPWFRTLDTGEGFENYVLGARSPRHPGVIWITVTCLPLLDDGEVSGAVVSISDITNMRNAQVALQASEERFRILAENAADVVYRFSVGPEPTFDYVNPAVEQALGYLPEDFYEDPALIVRLTHDDDVDVVRELGSVGVNDVRSVQLRMTRRDGTTIWTEHRIVPLRDAEGTVTGVTGIARDVTALKIKEAYLSHRALHDPLTGLPNRVLILDRIEAALARLRRHQSHLAVLYLDLDRFKTVNDNLGHEIGDRLLNVVARRLQETLRPSDSVARLGGDEFAALLPDLNDPSEATQVAERLLAAIAEPVDLDGMLVTTVSIGVAVASDGDTSAGELLRRSDFAMYTAKDRGRARVESYDAEASAGSTGAEPSA